MIFETQDVYVDFAQSADIDGLVRVYNSHPAFIHRHLSRNIVTRDWMAEETKTTRNAGFWPCKVVGKASGQIIGLIDVKLGTETYLSLLMVHQSYAHQGFGQQVYQGLEAFVRSHDSRTIRIDVVTGYDDRVLDFWVRNGFHVISDTTLEWDKRTLAAVTMTKTLGI
ncbi:GNAT family N-acetyltransferase [Sulfobacillus harzensis]|uniref:GNAT family N-acetyltransferase n=1 Tax=Sulfobacillus harzensis TaxID=2729629 RepID=A0A7Y0L5K5_9FIRM|nr:GNAT family N-acetyltransferase [Sulfobacillus harzensis]NMP23714.1 GNAT family N-acetyltransferase [Sulfobacillus harzensis]